MNCNCMKKLPNPSEIPNPPIIAVSAIINARILCFSKNEGTCEENAKNMESRERLIYELQRFEQLHHAVEQCLQSVDQDVCRNTTSLINVADRAHCLSMISG